LTGKVTGDPAFIRQLEWAGAPQAVIDKYNARFDFELWDMHLIAWSVVAILSPADMAFREQQSGKKIFTRFNGYKSTALVAIMGALKIKKAGKVLRQIKLIEYGALKVNGR